MVMKTSLLRFFSGMKKITRDEAERSALKEVIQMQNG